MNNEIKLKVLTGVSLLVAMIFLFPFNCFAEKQVDSSNFKAGFYYTVKKGDTLWDLSEQFSDSPWIWPNLWSGNKQVANPHLIYPGEKIRIFHKDWLIKMGVEKGVKEPDFYVYPQIPRTGFIKKKAMEPLGTIFKVRDDKVMISTGDLVYIREEKGNHLVKGCKYMVYRTINPHADGLTNKYVGIQHYMLGLVEVYKNEEGFVLAKVIESFRTIGKNDLIISYEEVLPCIELKQSKEGLDGEIIISEEHQVMFGDTSIAFIDRGVRDGVTQGQQYSIYSQDKGSLRGSGDKKVLLPPEEIGALLVLRTEPETSTVLITKSERTIESGARICYPLE